MNILVIGGGTGSSVVLEAIKRYKELKISVIVGMMDDGGSNAVVRDEFGLLPLSDVRKSILALADSQSNEVLRDLFTYRFSNGHSMKGHTLGNLLMIAMVDILGSEVEAIEMFRNIFSVNGNIIPVTLDDVRLSAQYNDGSKVIGEHFIDEPKEHKDIIKFHLTSPAQAHASAIEAIENADSIILGPGDLYTTILPNLLVKGIKEAIKGSKAKLIYITNLMSKIGQTRNRTQLEVVKILEKNMGRKFDFVLINNGKLPWNAYKRYIEDGEHVMDDDLKDKEGRIVIRRDFVADSTIKKDKGDTLQRSFIRHDPQKLGKELHRIFSIDRNRVARLFNTFLGYYKE